MLFYMHDVLCAGIRQRFQHRRPPPGNSEVSPRILCTYSERWKSSIIGGYASNGCITLTAPENGLLLSKRFVLNLLLKISIVRRGWHGSIDLQNINYKSIMQRRRISMEAIKRPLKKHKIRNYVETVKEGADNENFPDGVSRTIM